MNAIARFFRKALWGFALWAPVAGCASLEVPYPLAPDVAQKRRHRTQDAVREFESKRDFAQFQAALTHWDRGDVEASEQTLQRLLRRNPNHHQARLLMAEVRPAGDPPPAALEQAEQPPAVHPDDALDNSPDDARAQYTTALLLHATGQGTTALAYSARAAELEPDNELYKLGYQTALTAENATAENATAENATAEKGTGPIRPNGPQGASHKLDPSPFRQPQKTSPIIPDPTARPSEPVSSLEDHGPNRPLTATAAGDIQLTSTTPPGYSLAEATDRVDPTDSAEQSGADRSSVSPDSVSLDSVLLEEGREALAAGSTEAALVHFRKAAAVRPDDPQIPIAAAMASLRHERPDLAVELLFPVARKFSGSARLNRILGLAYYRLGDYQSSQVALRQALSVDKSSALSYLLMGCTLSKLGQTESAEAHLRQARTIDPRYTVRR